MTAGEDMPGLSPMTVDELSPEIREMLGPWAFNLHRTLAYSEQSLTQWMPFAKHILQENSLSVREREIAILRVGWNCRSPYEWGMHEGVARTAGFTDEDLDAICVGKGSDHWTASEAAILAAVDDLHAHSTIADGTWVQLKAHFTKQQLVDMVYLIGQFHLISIMLNAMRTPLENGLAPMPDDHPTFTRAY
jgi:4-carboxymuconolactone decarboxylase